MAAVADHLARIEHDGYTIVPDVFDADAADALIAELERLERDLGIAPSNNSFEGAKTVRVYNLLAHGPSSAAIPIEPEVLAVVDGVLDPGCLISSLSSIDIGPGEIAQPIHADDQLLPLPKPHVPTVCNSMRALTDFTEANGATRIIPGTHRSDHGPKYGADYDSIPAEMPAGAVLVWHGSLWHGGGANLTDARRVGIAMNYCAGWVRQQENQQLGLPVDLVSTFPKRLQELVGYGVYFGLIGHIRRTSPAKALLARDGGTPILWDQLT